MEIIYVMHLQSTGQELRRGPSTKAAFIWENTMCRKLLRYKRTPQTTKDAIAAGDVITGWANFDDWRRAGIGGTELQDAHAFIFRDYPEK